MADKNKMFNIAVILIILAFVAVGVGRYTGFIGSIVGVGDGYFIYGQSDTSITNQSCQAVNLDGASGQSCTGAYYTWSGSRHQYSSGGDGGTSWSVLGSDVDLIISTSGSQYGSFGQDPKVQTTKDFSSSEFRVDVTAVYGGIYGQSTGQALSISSSAAGTLASESFTSQGAGTSTFAGSMELKRNVFSNTTDVYWKGLLVKTYATPANEKIIYSVNAGQGSIGAHLTNTRYLPTFSCQLSSTDVLGMESFSGGVASALTLQPSACNNSTDVRCLRYPVKSFCLAHPTILTDSTQGGSTSTAEPYQILISGNQVPLTGTQTLTLFYVIDNSQGLIPTQCAISSAYNINNGTCTDLTGVVQICSQGILDSQTGLCVVQPSVACSSGTYNNATGQCQYVPPQAYVCDAGFTYNNITGNCEKTATPITACTDGRLDLQTNTCIYNPPVATVCNNGTYNNLTGNCELHIDTTCPSGFTYNPATQSCNAPTTYSHQIAQQQMQQPPVQTQQQTTSTTTTNLAYTSVAWWYSTPFLALLALAIICALLSLIFFTGSEGHRRWMKFKQWVSINKEGILAGLLIANVLLFLEFYPVFTIPFIGIVLELFRQSYPVWVVWFVVILLFMIAGAILDMLIDKKH